MKDQLLRIVRYNLWANERVSDFLNSLTVEQLDKEIISSFPSVRKTLYHIWCAQHLWLMRLHGDSPTYIPDIDFSGSFKEAKYKLLDSSEEFIEYVKLANDELLQSILTYKTTSGIEYKNTISDIIQHVVN